MIRSTAVFLLVGLAIGCGGGSLTATPAQSSDALSFTAPPGMARLYAMRPGALKGRGIVFDVFVDGTPRGALRLDGSMVFDLEPGRHRLYYVEQLYGPSEEIVFNLEAGRVYFVNLSDPRLPFVATEEGIRIVRGTTLYQPKPAGRVVSTEPE